MVSTVDKIKEAGLILFAEQGYEGTALSEIAGRVGIKAPSIYAHFASKQDLYLSILRDIVYKEMDTIKNLLESGTDKSIEESLKSLFYHLTNLAGATPQVLFYKRAVFLPPKDLSRQIKEEIIHFEELSAGYLHSIFSKGMKEKTIREMGTKVLHSSFYCLLDGLFFEHHLYEQNEFIQRRSLVWNFFWDSIKEK
ncbi:TetR/AcrR family transcriptional regulator [Peribacillus kribbensis]|uniref:TetR/AcrR family transcriptional regulator n=1 Tax=Peribacillus kribbensis TaxID=356658 RepID=UPI0004157F5C|nr:TetR/AcrR family transcriptional regulator [Peribacillus kribbensis]